MKCLLNTRKSWHPIYLLFIHSVINQQIVWAIRSILQQYYDPFIIWAFFFCVHGICGAVVPGSIHSLYLFPWEHSLEIELFIHLFYFFIFFFHSASNFINKKKYSTEQVWMGILKCRQSLNAIFDAILQYSWLCYVWSLLKPRKLIFMTLVSMDNRINILPHCWDNISSHYITSQLFGCSPENVTKFTMSGLHL